MSKTWWRFWETEKKSANTLGVLIRQANSNFNSYAFNQFVSEAYYKNTTVYACVQEYIKAFLSCPIIIKRGDDVIENKTLTALLKQPNITQTWPEFLEQAVIYYLVGGECPLFGESAIATRPPKELYILRPDWLEPVYSNFGELIYWKYTPTDSNTKRMQIVPNDMKLWKKYNPLNTYRGVSPLLSASYAIDQLNEYNRTNYSLLRNALQPSGALTTESNLEDDAFERLKKQFEEQYMGSSNNGKPLVLEGGLSWQPFGFNMRDAEFLGGKVSSKRDICEALSVPNQILGIEGSQTFANYEQARASFYEDSAIPLMNSFLSVLMNWLSHRVGLLDTDNLVVDIDAVAALEPRRTERNKVLDTMQSISTNEKRQGMGYEAIEGGDIVLVNSGLIPLDMAGADIPTQPMF